MHPKEAPDSAAAGNAAEELPQNTAQMSRAEASHLGAYVALNVLESAMGRYTDDERSTLDAESAFSSLLQRRSSQGHAKKPNVADAAKAQADTPQLQLPPRKCRVAVVGANSSLGHFLIQEAMLRYNCDVTAYARNRAEAMVNLHHLTNPHFHVDDLKRRGYTVLNENLLEMVNRGRGQLRLVDGDLSAPNADAVLQNVIQGADAVFYTATSHAGTLEAMFPRVLGRRFMVGAGSTESSFYAGQTMVQHSPFDLDLMIPLRLMRMTQRGDAHFVYFSTQRARKMFHGGPVYLYHDSLLQMKRKRQFEEAALQPYDQWRSWHGGCEEQEDDKESGGGDGQPDGAQRLARRLFPPRVCDTVFGKVYDPIGSGGFAGSRGKVTIFRPYDLSASGNWGGLGLSKRVKLLDHDYKGGVASAVNAGTILKHEGGGVVWPEAGGAYTGDVALKTNPPRVSKSSTDYSKLSYEMMAVLAMRSVLLYPRTVENSVIDVYCDKLPNDKRPTLQEVDRHIAELP